MPQLSQELVDKILDHVADASTDWLGENLLQCALVNRSFRPRSQSYIFSTINIHGEASFRQQKVESLLEVVQENPEIGHYIGELTLECTDYKYSWIFEDQTFLSLMRLISNAENPLRKLTIFPDTDIEEDNDCFLENAKPLVEKFFLPFISPFITSLSLQRLSNVPIEAVTACVNLTDLELLCVVLETSTDESVYISQSLKLRHLAHRLSQDALSKLLDPNSNGEGSALDLSQLKLFIVYTDELRDLAFEQKIIDLSSGSLEDLNIITLLTATNRLFHGSTDLHRCTHLRSLHAHVMFPEDSLVSIRQTLSSIPSNSLESLIIEAKVSVNDLSEPDVMLNADWADFISEVNRVMVDTGFNLDIKMSYLYQHLKNVVLEEYRSLKETRCRSVVERLRGNELRTLRDNPHANFVLTHELVFDALYEYTLEDDDFD